MRSRSFHLFLRVATAAAAAVALAVATAAVAGTHIRGGMIEVARARGNRPDILEVAACRRRGFVDLLKLYLPAAVVGLRQRRSAAACPGSFPSGLQAALISFYPRVA